MENAATRNDAIADFNIKPKVLDSNDVEYRSREIGHEIRERGALVRSSSPVRLNIAGVRSMEIARRVAIKRTKQAYVCNLWRYVNIATKRRNPRTPDKRVAVINREAIIAGSTISNELIRLLVRRFSVVLRSSFLITRLRGTRATRIAATRRSTRYRFAFTTGVKGRADETTLCHEPKEIRVGPRLSPRAEKRKGRKNTRDLRKGVVVRSACVQR